MKRSEKIAAVTLLVGVAVALVYPAAASAGTLPPAEKTAQESVLRLVELPAGYVLGDSWYCGAPPEESEEEGIFEQEEDLPPTPYEAFLERNKPTICMFEYERLYRPSGAPPGPPLLYSFALATPSAEAAQNGLAVGAELAANALRLHSLYPAAAAPHVGEASLLFHDNLVRFRHRTHLPGTIALWRDGSVIAGTFAGGGPPAVNDAAVRRYAPLQQAVIEAPRPYLRSEAEDISTFFENPNLHVPIYWLGREFRPGHGIPPAYFASALAPEDLDYSLVGRRMRTIYNPSLFIDSWTPSSWARFSRTVVGRRQWSWRCTRSRSIDLPRGHAVLYAAYKKDYATCPASAPHHFSVHVFLPGAVLEIGEPLCRYCQGDIYDYESWRGLEAIARGLRRWHPAAGAN